MCDTIARSTEGEAESQVGLLEYYRIEADHFYQAERQHEERANWLVAIASGVLAFNINELRGAMDEQLSAVACAWLKTTIPILALASVVGLVTIWPLAGRKATLWRPFKRPSGSRIVRGGTLHEVVRAHYDAHRLRAYRKAACAVVAASLLGIGLVVSSVGWYLAFS